MQANGGGTGAGGGLVEALIGLLAQQQLGQVGAGVVATPAPPAVSPDAPTAPATE